MEAFDADHYSVDEDYYGYDEDIEEAEDLEQSWLANECIGLFLFMLCVTIASIVSIAVIGTYKVVERMAAVEEEIVPFRTVNHGIWPGYRHEFFNQRLPFIKAEQVCLSRDQASLLPFKSQEQEDAFDMYVSINFWSATDYPAFQLWTSGIIMARRVQGQPNMTVLWPEPMEEFNHIRECAVRGEGIVNAFAAHEQFWQERHIVKDYITENQQQLDASGSRSGCWQHVKRNDWMPESFYRFVCSRKIE